MRSKAGRLAPRPADSRATTCRKVRTSDTERGQTGRKRLATRRDWLASFPERNPHPITEVDLSGRVHYANEAARRLFPTLERDGLSHPWLADWAAVVRKLEQGDLSTCERSVVVGEALYEQSMYCLPEPRLVRIYGLDVTARWQAEAALRESEARLRFALEVSRTGAWELDLEQRKVLCSLEHDRIFGYSGPPPEWTYEKFLGHVLPEDREAVDQQLRRAMQTGGEWSFECRIRRVDGEVRWIWAAGRHRADATGAPRRMVGIVQEITDSKRAQAALRVSEERHKLLAETMLQGIVHQDAEGRIVSMNSAAQRILGKTPQEFLGSSSVGEERDTVREDGSPFPGLEHPAMVALRTGQPVREVVMGVLNPREGAYRWISVDAVPLLRPGETRPYEVYTVFADITERRRAEAELRAANLQLAEADRHKNEFLATLSHELRNPLTPIRNSLFVLEHVPAESEQARHAREVIARQTGQLARLVDDLLDLTRISRNKIRLQRHPLDLNDVVRRTVEDHRSLFEERGVRLETRLEPEPLQVRGDEVRLAQVVSNLLQNAAKFTPAGGQVEVRSGRVVSRGRGELRIVDDGVGIEPETLGRLFQPFMQAAMRLDRSAGGLGLGLALVKGIVELHGGEVRAQSGGPGLGSEFVIELPLEKTDAAVAGAAEPGAAPRSRRVLIIEDNVDAAESLRDALLLGGHVVEVAHDGCQGLTVARAFKPELVLCDIGLPEMDGFEVARAFRADESLKQTLLVALSGYVLPEDRQRAAEAGFERHLAKPPSMEELSELLASVPEPAAAAASRA